MAKLEFGHLKAEWHPTRNHPLFFSSSLSTGKKYWWLGICGHEWDANLGHRRDGSGCPFCSNKRVLAGFNDLATKNPVLAAEWHPTKNGELTPQQVTIGSNTIVWWQGSLCRHEWDSPVTDRLRGNTVGGCPICSNRRILSGINDLATKNPVLAAEWHPTKNGELTAEQVTVGSNTIVWWLGKCGHEWEMSPHKRGQGSGCSVCSSKVVLAGFNDLATKNPVLAAEWHPTKNGELTPQQVTVGSNKKIWWLGKCGHEWDAAVGHRNNKSGCPFCSNKKVLAGFNDLATKNPVLAAEWHSIKNGELTPQQVTGGSNKKIWWLGKCGHEWDAAIVSRINGSGCPVCIGQKVIAGFNDFSSANPLLATEWHPTKNGELTPQHVTERSGRKFWWLGKCGHEWESRVVDRTTGSGCPACSGHLILAGFNDLATKNPILATEWHPTKNGKLTTRQILAGGNRTVWWLGNCGHEWSAAVVSRIKGSGCPVCSGHSVLLGFNDLSTKNPSIAFEWHPTKNGELTTQHVLAGSKSKAWWLGKCNHEWEASISNRTGRDSGCPYCSGTKVLKGFNDLATVNPTLAAEWHPTKNGDVTPEYVGRGSNRKFWWQCELKHEWKTTVNDRTTGGRCHVCSGYWVLIGFNDLATTHPNIASEWHPTKNVQIPTEIVGRGSGKKYWWQCDEGHEWEAILTSRINGHNCPYCSGNRVIGGKTDVFTRYPHLLNELHPTKNKEKFDFSLEGASSTRKLWWLGDCGHEWETTINNRTSGSGCHFCSGKNIYVGINDLATINSVVASEWHPTKNGELTAQQITAANPKKAWWLGACGHEWEARVADRNDGSRCPFCSGYKVLSGFNDLATKNPILATEWHPTKNETLTAGNVTHRTDKKVWWLGLCGHEWVARVADRTGGPSSAGQGCPFCSGHRVLSGFNDLATINPSLAAEWHPTKNGELTPKQVSSSSSQKVWWLGACGHEWDIRVTERAKGNGCPICVNSRVLIGFNDLATTHPEVTQEWHPTKNRELTAQKVVAGSKRKVWWLGKCGHEWEATLQSRSRIGTGCGKCSPQVSKPEEQVKRFLETLGMKIESSNRTVLGGKKEIDIWIPEKQVGIEFNGTHWHKEKFRGKDFHYIKWVASKQAAIQLIQIWEDDWNLNSEIIKQILTNKLDVFESKPMRKTKVILITEKQAENFLENNHLQGFASGSYYLGIVEVGNIEKLQSVMVLKHKSKKGDKALEIIRYVSTANVRDDFSQILAFAIDAYSPESIIVIADHCEANEELYANNDFIAEEELLPDYMYVIRNVRKPRSAYSIERFRDDPALKWEDGVTEMELADLNGLDRIWDAGRTLYRYWV